MNRALVVLIVTLADVLAPRIAKGYIEENGPSPPDSISEIIPIKYAGSADITAALTGSVCQYVDRMHGAVNKAWIENAVGTLGHQKVIVNDERSNSLLVVASPPEMARIKDIIARLDVVVAQILVEAAVIELRFDKEKPLRRAAAQSRGVGELCRRFSALSHLHVRPATAFLSVEATNALDSQCGQFSYVARLSGDLDAAVNSFATNSGVKVLQRPRIPTSEGKPVAIFAGSAYPNYCPYYPPARPPSSQFIRTGSDLELTCFLSKEGLILTDIEQQIETVTGTVTIANVGDVPQTTKKMVQAHVAIREGETIVIGGLADTVEMPRFSRIDPLDHVPLVGDLLNKLITWPTRKIPCEIVVLMRAKVLPAPKIAPAPVASAQAPSGAP